MQVEDWPLSRIIRYERNPHKRSKKSVTKIAASIKDFGPRQPIVVDEAGVILVGHGRLDGAELLGLPTFPVHQALGLSEQQKTAYRIADNRTNEESEFEEDALKLELSSLEGFDLSMTGFDLRQVNSYLRGGPVDGEDNVPDPGPAVTQRGDLWEMGEHRLLCGDATSAEDHEATLDGAKPDLVLTDPPYGVGVAYASFDDSAEKTRALIAAFFPLIAKWPVIALTSGHRCMWDYPKPTWVMAWIHPAGNGNGPWGFNQFHPVLVYGKDPQLKHGLGSHPDSLVLAAGREGQAGHPTPKPVSVWRWFLTRCSVNRGDIIFDPFLGSGTTLIACETEGRRCYGLEIEPRYCDVIVARWEKFTGKAAVLERREVAA